MSTQTTAEATIIAVESEKGGQGKTTTALNLGTMLTLMGRRVLLVDCNPDGGLTFSLGYNKDHIKKSAYEAILEEAKETRTITFQDIIVPTWYNPETKGFFDPDRQVAPQDRASVTTALEDLKSRGVKPMRGPFLAPISNQAVHADSELKSAAPMTWFLALKDALTPVQQYFDYVIVDTNPSAGCLAAVALSTARYFYIPIVPEMLSVNGMMGLFKLVRTTKKQANPGLQLAGILFTKVQNYRSHRDIILKLREELAREHPDMQISFFETQIQQCKDGVDASADRSAAVVHRPYTDHAISYWYFLGELLQQVGGSALALMPEILRGIQERQEKQRLAELQRKEEREARTAQ